MPQIYLCFLWHMHQPFYKDLVSGEYKLPWTRMHALKDYYGMARILEEFPEIKQTFNLVPSMMVQVEEYAAGQAADPFLQVALKPAEELDERERAFLLRNSFLAPPARMIYRYPRYGELFDAARPQANAGSRWLFGPRDLRDLQMWSQLAWFDEEFQEHDPEVREWIERGRDFTLDDQRRMGEKQTEIVASVLPIYRKLAAAGQIEISTTPYYHPILPLLCDSNIASTAHPGVSLPPPFRYPGDARLQLAMARDYCAQRFGAPPRGLWPSEGSVSDEVFGIASELGFEWAATDSGVLGRTTGAAVAVAGLYRPYEWRQAGRALHVVFRDHFLSDLIGFVYSGMDAAPAAGDFLHRIRGNCAEILATGRDALVPIILDGENAWEFYHRNGRPFLRELYRRISEDRGMRAVTIGEALRLMAPEPLDHIFPASWIDSNFDVWIGAEEDNQAWTQLLRARQTFDAASQAASGAVPQAGQPALPTEEQRRRAFEEILIAEGSDWCWWYGPEHQSNQRPEFDQLFRNHLANVYHFLNLAPPEELSRPILRAPVPDERVEPSGAIHPTIDGEITSYFEWIGAGICRVDERTGSMHGRKFFIQEVSFGSDGGNLFVRVDFHPGAAAEIPGMEARFTFGTQRLTLTFDHGAVQAAGNLEPPVECALGRILEARIPLAAIGVAPGAGLRFQVSLWRGGLPVDAVPQQGWIEMRTTNPLEMG